MLLLMLIRFMDFSYNKYSYDNNIGFISNYIFHSIIIIMMIRSTSIASVDNNIRHMMMTILIQVHPLTYYPLLADVFESGGFCVHPSLTSSTTFDDADIDVVTFHVHCL